VIGHLKHPGIGREHARFGVQILGLERGALGVDNEGAHSAVRSRFVFRIAEGDHGVGDAAIGNQILHAIEQVFITDASIGGGHFQRIRAGIGLGQSKRQDLFGAA